MPLCNLQQFGYDLCDITKKAARGCDIVVWKCYVKGAYCLILMHPLWQMLQVVKLPDGHYAVNQNNIFGGGASGHCWWCLMSLILWVACKHFGCTCLNDYVNDVFAAAFATSLLLYPRYMQLMPWLQVQFLRCLDALDILHKGPKQLSG